MTTVQENEFKVSTVLTVQGNFTSFSDNLVAVNDQIDIGGILCEAVLVELDWSKQLLEVYINVPVMAVDEDEAEELAQAILDDAKVTTLTLLDYEKGEGYIIEVMESYKFAQAEYYC